jgi:hypothetical protein
MIGKAGTAAATAMAAPTAPYGQLDPRALGWSLRP